MPREPKRFEHQAGQAPEPEILRPHEIDACEGETKRVTSQLETLASASLRAHRHRVDLEPTRRGLEIAIEASAAIVLPRSASDLTRRSAQQEEAEETQREIATLLGDAVDSHSEETGDHVRRVAEISKILALAYGLPESEAELIRSASPLHDVGKSGIPDAILHKPGKYSSEEWEIMKTHTLVGWEMLRTSRLPAMRVGAAIALEHHERWDGTGYPHGRAGEEIHLYGRITALADVFDALGSERCYKPAWPLDEMLAFFERERDRQFDARLVDLLFEHLEPIVAIRDRCAEQLGSARCAQGF